MNAKIRIECKCKSLNLLKLIVLRNSPQRRKLYYEVAFSLHFEIAPLATLSHTFPGGDVVDRLLSVNGFVNAVFIEPAIEAETKLYIPRSYHEILKIKHQKRNYDRIEPIMKMLRESEYELNLITHNEVLADENENKFTIHIK